jgi:crotonobetainyl-CoA:carnitine CoA-transferase CaiB-like acyl-CoA transferase
VGALSDYLVLDATDEKGMLCSTLLTGMGAKVIRVELEKEVEQAQFGGLVKKADVLIESFPPGHLTSLGLGYTYLSQINPGLVMVSITPFGQSGPYKDYKACDFTIQALGGWLSVTGEPRAPLKLFGNQAYHTASLFATNGILLALWHRHATGRGQYIDISILESVAATLDHALVRYFYEGIVSQRQGSLYWNNAFRVFTCQDGYVLLSLRQNWETLVEWLASEGVTVDLTDAKFQDRDQRDGNIVYLIGVLQNWTSYYKAKELVEKGQLMHFPWAEVVSVSQKEKGK